jgi:hypothetical protein
MGVINKAGGHRPRLGGPPIYHPNRRDWPPLPDPLRWCDRCNEHAAVFGPDEQGRFYCGPCVGRVDIFHANQVGANSAVQMKADHALGRQSQRDDQ